MPKITTLNGPQQMACSDGAKILIEQMKLHPEEFKGYAGKFTTLLDRAHDVQHNSAIRGMSKRDSAAILAAAETHLYEVWLAADVLTLMMQPKQEEEKASGRSVPAVWQGALPPGSVITSNTKSSYYDQVYQLEMQRRELEKIELKRQRNQEDEYAMLITKPFMPVL